MAKTLKNKKQPTKKAQSRQATTEKLMLTGLEVFSKFGFNGTTTKVISLRSGVNESLIIRYFKSKSGLFLAILKDAIQKSRLAESHYPKGSTVDQEIENYLRFHYEKAMANRDFMRMILSQLAIDPKIRSQITTFVKTMLKEEGSELVNRLGEFQTRGIIRKDVDIERAAEVIGQVEMGNNFMISMVPYVEPKEIFANNEFFATEMSRGLSYAQNSR